MACWSRAAGANCALALGPFGGLPEELLAAPYGLHQGQIRELQERGPQEAHQFGRLTRRLDLPGLGWGPLLNLASVRLLLAQADRVQVPLVSPEGLQKGDLLQGF